MTSKARFTRHSMVNNKELMSQHIPVLGSAVYAVTMCPSVKPAFQQNGYMDRAQFLALIKRYIEQLSKHW